MTASGVISRVIGFFYRVFLSRTIGAEALGIYQLIGPVFSICFSLCSSSIQTSITKFVSGAVGNCEKHPCARAKAKAYLALGLFFSLILTAITACILHQNADLIATRFLKDARCTPLIILLSYSLIPSSIHSCISGYYYGLKKALIPSLGQLIEQFARVFSVWIIYRLLQASHTPLNAWHAVLGIVISEFFGLLFSLSIFAFEKKTDTSVLSQVKTNFITMSFALWSMALPLTVNRLLLSLSASIENALIPQQLQAYGYCLSDALSIFGCLSGMAMPIILFPSVVTNSLSVLLLPSVSEARAKKDQTRIEKTIRLVILYGFLMGFAFSLFFLLSGKFIGEKLFCNTLSGHFIQRLSFLCPLIFISSLLSSVLNGIGKAKTILWINLLGSLIRISMIYLLIPMTGIGAYLWSMILSQSFVTLVLVYETSHTACSLRSM